CAPQPSAYGPAVKPDTDAAFVKSATLQKNSINNVPPPGWAKIFSNATASINGDDQTKYLGYFELKGYNASECADYCDDVDGCIAFNMFYERDPVLNPADSCPNPAGSTHIKCSIWGSPVTIDKATNSGQWRHQFHVVIAGSNG
ncbi:hypothetical protein K402DRAFT_314231, partial [Aulographum hederae CBS 113979]